MTHRRSPPCSKLHGRDVFIADAARVASMTGLAAWTLRAAAVCSMIGASSGLATALSAQAVDDASRLGGIQRVDVTAEAQWDELITTEAGAATEAQFLEALGMTFADAMEGGESGPTLLAGAPVTVRCHVDTFYDRGLIVYGLRVQTEAPGDDGEPTITWIKSWVGSYTVQQLHLMFRLGEQCAESFLEDWRRVN